MNEDIQRQLVRQLKLLNFWITTFGVLFLVAFAIILYFLFQTVMFVRDTSQKIDTFKTEVNSSLDVKKQVCDGEGGLSDFLRQSTKTCQ